MIATVGWWSVTIFTVSETGLRTISEPTPPKVLVIQHVLLSPPLTTPLILNFEYF